MNLLHFDSERAWLNTVVALWRDRLKVNPRLRLCLPSGNTPNKIYAEMGRSVAAGLLSFRDAEIFALDDYGGLAPDDPGRCRNMLQRYLLDHIDLPPERFHFIDTEAPDLDRVCREYDALIESRGGFDLTLLGIGLNGHLGLNEPGSATDSSTRRVQMHESTVKASASYLTHANLPTWGVGVGLKHLLASREIWLLANGTRKAEIIQRTLRGEIGLAVPATLLRTHPNSLVLVDAEAGALLDQPFS
ncbi:MAG: glucosamine-6-phosphate deaminase [Verrucomicrobiales bacterium]|nr:glucosamine-6-phosphate deaminase [Verrucomicrobiales bacterium]